MRLHPIFCDHMVLQRGKPIRIFGSGQGAGEVRLAGQSAPALPFEDGWMATLPPMEAGGPYALEATLEGETFLVYDVLIGDVFLIAGQSNMKFRTEEGPQPEGGYPEDPYLRYFGVRCPEHESPTDGHWELCDRETALQWSAIGYYFAALLRRERDIPVGLVACFQGAAMIQAFLDKSRITGGPLDLPDEQKHCDFGYFPLWNRDGLLYRGMFRKITPYGFHSVIWYQGESNTSLAEGRIYDLFLRELIGEWRADLMSDLPFVIVQIHAYSGGIPEGWRLVREAQERACGDIPGCALVRTSDLGEENAIHPTRKAPVGERVFKAVLNLEKS